MNIKEKFKEMEFYHCQYYIKTQEIVDELNSRFKTDIVEDIVYQPSDGYLVLWNDGDTSIFNIENIKKIKNEQEFIKYLKENVI